MPQFTYDPNNPGAMYINTATSGFSESGKPKEPEAFKSTTAAAAPGKTAAEKAADRKAARKKAADERKAAAAAAAAAERNPLTSSFKTPNEIRAEAARLAALGSVSEEALRTESAAQQRDISGLSTALTGRLAGLGSEYAATLGGLTSQYGQLAGQAQSAGESAAAAAGAPTSIAPGASPTVATTMAALGAVPATYAPAAAMRGAMLGGEARSALTKALADRATKVSSDTAKYLYQLQQDEMSKAVAQSASAQNAARLAQSGAAESWNQQVDVARLGQGQQRIDIQAQRAAASVLAAATKGAKSKQDKIQRAKAAILKDPTKFMEISNPNAKIWDVVYMLEGVPYTIPGIEAANEYAARDKALSNLPDAQQGLFASNTASWLPSPPAKEATRQRTNEEIIRFLVPQLVNAGMKRANAIAWVRKNILTPTSTPTSSGVSSTMYPTT
jgi:hypothetical protein